MGWLELADLCWVFIQLLGWVLGHFGSALDVIDNQFSGWVSPVKQSVFFRGMPLRIGFHCIIWFAANWMVCLCQSLQLVGFNSCQGAQLQTQTPTCPLPLSLRIMHMMSSCWTAFLQSAQAEVMQHSSQIQKQRDHHGIWPHRPRPYFRTTKQMHLDGFWISCIMIKCKTSSYL